METETPVEVERLTGIWVCAASGSVISPYLFIQAAGDGRELASSTAAWHGSGQVPRFTGAAEGLPLIGGGADRPAPGLGALHLFSAKLPAVAFLESRSRLQDWKFPVPLAGIVVLFDRQADNVAVFRLLRLLGLARTVRNRTLGWAQAQRLPLAVAATGYDRGRDAEGGFRRQFGLSTDTPVLPGPALASVRPEKAGAEAPERRNLLSAFLSPDKLGFDPHYARRVLQGLCERIKAENRPAAIPIDPGPLIR